MAAMRIVSILHETARYWWKQSFTIHAVFQNRVMWHKYVNCWNTYVMDSPKLRFHNSRDRSYWTVRDLIQMLVQMLVANFPRCLLLRHSS
jgi:hypothetical protein